MGRSRQYRDEASAGERMEIDGKWSSASGWLQPPAGTMTPSPALASAAVDRLYGTAFLILRDGDRAEDAVQDALVRAWRQIGRLRDHDQFDAWLTRLVVNACYDEGRRIRRRAEVACCRPTIVRRRTLGVHVIERERLERGFRRLPIEQRAVLVLGQHLGLSHPEIAK